MRNVLKALVVVAGLTVAQNAGAANLIQNGDFENPVLAAPFWALFNLPAGNTQITNWTITQGNVDLTHTCCYGPGAYGGSNNAVDLIGDGAQGGIAQSFATVTGQEYLLTFAFAHNDGLFSPTGYAARVTVADGNAPANMVLDEDVERIQGQSGYEIFSQTFFANSDWTILSFINLRGSSSGGIYLDAVSVELVDSETPIPGALPLFVGGLGVMAFLARRRKQKAAMA